MAATPPTAAARLPPLTCTCVGEGAVTTAAPQVLAGLGPAGTLRPAGRLSVTDRLLAGWELPFEKVSRRRDRSPGLTTPGVNCLTTPILVCVVRLVVACRLFDSPWSVRMAPTGMKLVMPPVLVVVTLMDSVQLAAAASETPPIATEPPPGTAVTPPPGQVVDGDGLAATVMPLAGDAAWPSLVK